MKKLICLRDDDTNFFTKYEMLEEGYGEFWGKLPVTLATVPFAHGSERKIIDMEIPANRKFINLREWELGASAQELTEYQKVHPIGENKELVEKLKEMLAKGKVEIAQHGVFHKYNEYGPEMYYDNVGLESIRAGKEYLNKVFETQVKVFIPPSNTIDPTCARYINNIGMDLLTCGGISYRNKSEKVYEFCKYPVDVFKTAKSRLLNELPAVRRRKGIDIFSGITFNKDDDVDVVYNKAKKMLDTNSAVAITTHYRLLGELDNEEQTYKKKWNVFLHMLCEVENVEFVTASKYIEEIKKRKSLS